jgi:AAA domain
MDFEAFNQRLPAPIANPVIFPDIVAGTKIQKVRLELPPEMICGVLAQGEKGELAGGSKSFKTWALIHQALAIAAGIPWWAFETCKNNVLFLNLEIPAPFFELRVRSVADALSIDIPPNFYVWHLRNSKLGEAGRWNQFLLGLKERCSAIANPFLTSDPIYKLLGGRNENSAGDVAQLLEQLDDMVELTGGANFFGHHFAKGPASSKETIDRASGSGVFQRDPDTIFIMTPHKDDGAFTVDAILRNHRPIPPFVVQWDYPIFRCVAADPSQLRPTKIGAPKRYDPKILVELLGRDCLSTVQLRKRVTDETDMAKSTFFVLLKEAEEQQLIVRDEIAKTWEVCAG